MYTDGRAKLLFEFWWKFHTQMHVGSLNGDVSS